MQESIYRYIQDFVLCKSCANPETTIEKRKKKSFMICAACGNQNEMV
jgi:translation initiation factor 2 beta subunit (eIF-2beta)/eIF-5